MKKGQESAPIEVLIGVTILTFVLIIAMNIFQSSCSSQYEQKLNAGFSKFARDLEFVYMGAPGTSISTTLDLSVPSGCESVHLQSIRLEKGEKATCKARLGKDSCMMLIALLVPDNKESTVQNFLTIEVVDIPSTATVIYRKETATGEECGKDLKALSSTDAAWEECSFKPTFYTLKITKIENEVIEISS